MGPYLAEESHVYPTGIPASAAALRYSVYYPSKVDCICLKLLFACYALSVVLGAGRQLAKLLEALRPVPGG